MPGKMNFCNMFSSEPLNDNFVAIINPIIQKLLVQKWLTPISENPGFESWLRYGFFNWYKENDSDSKTKVTVIVKS
jgi:hypothetical protein